MKKVSILGCGWVGKALKDALSYEVHCLSRDMGANSQARLYDCDVLVIAIPPRDNYLEILAQTLEQIDPKTQVILLSSISYYDAKPLVVEAEALLVHRCKDVTILRLGGLMGYDRIAGKYTAGKTLASNSTTNYIHRDDVLGIIAAIISQEIRTEVFDVIAPIQSNKKEIFSLNAKRFGFEETLFLDAYTVGKKLIPQRLIDVLGYDFVREDVCGFWVKPLNTH